jgi:hypothetical protein
MAGDILGYARVSTGDQDVGGQSLRLGVIVTTVQKVTVRQAVVMACLSGFTVDLSH